MTTRLDKMQALLQEALGDRIRTLTIALGEVTVEIDGKYQQEACGRLRDDPQLAFDTLIDLCGVDYER
ncbi:MAG TPA: NADH-quinone oxidoreductase subunit C, partial [Lautropia sp.]|nr:NADH-quinone oxidoreductase subunit C [Lautropia sp.]